MTAAVIKMAATFGRIRATVIIYSIYCVGSSASSELDKYRLKLLVNS